MNTNKHNRELKRIDNQFQIFTLNPYILQPKSEDAGQCVSIAMARTSTQNIFMIAL